MNRPAALSYAIGNPVSGLVLGGVSASLLWRWWYGGVSDFVAVVAMVVLFSTMQAVKRVAGYKSWNRQWDAMAGIPPQPGIRQRIQQSPPLRVLGLSIIWVVIFLATRPSADDVTTVLGVAVYHHPRAQSDLVRFGFLPVLVVIPVVVFVTVFGPAFQRFRRRTTRQKSLAPVTLVLRRPVNSPSREMAAREVPDYCKALLDRAR